MFALDHVALPTRDIAGTARYYVDNFGAQVIYQDATWAFLRLGEGKLALVTPEQHPMHVALRVNQEQLEAASKKNGTPIDKHRDGTQGIYMTDPAGNAVELICYPAGQTTYDPKTEAEVANPKARRRGYGDGA
jgi:catechol 2,3-dioxygenase-like lactoylglutathione lyase family enzyme